MQGFSREGQDCVPGSFLKTLGFTYLFPWSTVSSVCYKTQLSLRVSSIARREAQGDTTWVLHTTQDNLTSLQDHVAAVFKLNSDSKNYAPVFQRQIEEKSTEE